MPLAKIRRERLSNELMELMIPKVTTKKKYPISPIGTVTVRYRNMENMANKPNAKPNFKSASLSKKHNTNNMLLKRK
jgi:hypothetical protein